MKTEDTDDAPDEGTIEIRRRATADRRQKNVPVTHDRRDGGDRRKDKEEGVRRRQVDPTTCEKEYSEEEMAFMKAMDLYKRNNRRPFPTWSEVLEVIRSLGYRRTEEATAMPGVPVAKPAGA